MNIVNSAHFTQSSFFDFRKLKLISNIKFHTNLKWTTGKFLYCPKSISRKLYLNFAFILNFTPKILTMIIFTFWNNIKTFSGDFWRLEHSEQALGSWARRKFAYHVCTWYVPGRYLVHTVMVCVVCW